MKENIYNEMLVHVAACTHKEPKKVLVVSDNANGLLEEIQKYGDIGCVAISANLDMLREAQENEYDIVLSEIESDKVSVAHISRVLKEDGLAVVCDVDLNDEADAKVKLQELGKSFKIVMPYSALGPKTFMLVSKEYHPTADIILQRADLTDGFEVYNSDLHVGVFAMPTYIKKQYLGLLKN